MPNQRTTVETEINPGSDQIMMVQAALVAAANEYPDIAQVWEDSPSQFVVDMAVFAVITAQSIGTDPDNYLELIAEVRSIVDDLVQGFEKGLTPTHKGGTA